MNAEYVWSKFGSSVCLQHGKVALVRVPGRLAHLEPLGVIVPAHVDELHASLDEPAGQQRRRAEQRPAVALARAVVLAAQVERLANFGRSEHLEGQPLLARKVAQVAARVELAKLVVELLDQPAAAVRADRA